MSADVELIWPRMLPPPFRATRSAYVQVPPERDVYKRQPLCSQPAVAQLRDAARRVHGHAGQQREAAGPVSYTHLDVYKRQV